MEMESGAKSSFTQKKGVFPVLDRQDFWSARLVSLSFVAQENKSTVPINASPDLQPGWLHVRPPPPAVVVAHRRLHLLRDSG